MYEFKTCIDPPIMTSKAFSSGAIDSVGGEGGGTGIVTDLLDLALVLPDFPTLLLLLSWNCW
jgi:hypothetical protein